MCDAARQAHKGRQGVLLYLVVGVTVDQKHDHAGNHPDK